MPRLSRLRSFLLALVPALGVALAFWVPAREAARGWFPSPLDDVYIHFDFARALATGHPFEWIPGQGYSSGETAPLYAVILAIGHVLGFHGRWLGVWAAIVAVLSVASLVRATARLVGPLPWYLTAILAVLPLAFGIVDWALFSGMEVAPFAAALGAALLALERTRAPTTERAMTRERAQWILGAWGAPLVLLRPEAAVLVFVFAVVAARGAGTRSGFAALFRAALPGALATVLVALANRLGQGDPRSAGVQLKLLSSNPYLSEIDRARVFVENLVTLYVRVVRGELSFSPGLAVAIPVLGLVALASPKKRPIAAACLLGAFGWTLLVSWNGNAPHHNFRYYAPAILLMAIAAALGLSLLGGRRGRRAHVVGALGAAAILASTASTLPRQIEHFRLATGNIRDQHIELAERIARLPVDVRVLVGDAGAIPFVSNRSAVDALGLGGYRGLPFASAAVHGEPATLELLEHLAPSERPTHLALYPNWFRHTTSRFGVEIDRVTLARNVICGGPTKALYRADWSAFDPSPRGANVFDELDVAVVLSEAEHAYVSPAPNGGWTVLDVLDGRFDGGRIIPAGGVESFVLRGAPPGRARVVIRTDARPGRVVVRSPRGESDVVYDVARAGSWTNGAAVFDSLGIGDRIEIVAVGVELRDYHVWIEGE